MDDLDFLDNFELDEALQEDAQEVVAQPSPAPLFAPPPPRARANRTFEEKIDNPVVSDPVRELVVGTNFMKTDVKIKINPSSMSVPDLNALLHGKKLWNLGVLYDEFLRSTDAPGAKIQLKRDSTAPIPITFVMVCSAPAKEDDRAKKIFMYDLALRRRFQATAFTNFVENGVYAIINLTAVKASKGIYVSLKQSDLLVGVTSPTFCSANNCKTLVDVSGDKCSAHRNMASSLTSASHLISPLTVSELSGVNPDQKYSSKDEDLFSMKIKIDDKIDNSADIIDSLKNQYAGTRAAQLLLPQQPKLHTLTNSPLKTSFTPINNIFGGKSATARLKTQKNEESIQKLAEEEAKELYLDTIKEVKVKAWRCSKCGTLSTNKPEVCIDAGHYCKLIDTVKRFWECGNCGMRCTSIGGFAPGVDCKKCKERRWKPSTAASQGYFTTVSKALGRKI